MARRKRALVVPPSEVAPVPTPAAAAARAVAEMRGLGLVEGAAAGSDADAERLAAILADPRYQPLIEIVDLAFQVHGERAREWLQHPEPELGYVLPLTLLKDPANGPKLVKQTLMNHLRCPYTLGDDGKVLPKRALGRSSSTRALKNDAGR